MRKRIDPVGTFTAIECERGAQLPDRGLELLKREQVAPPQLTEAGRGRPARFDFPALGAVVMTGALTRVVGGMVPAARIASGIVPELRAIYGHVPFGMDDLARDLRDRQSELRNPDGELCPYRTFRAAWRAGLVDHGTARPNDYVLVIIDGEAVGQSTPRNPGAVDAVLRYEAPRPGEGMRLHDLTAASEAEQAAFQGRLANAESVLRLNISLALRRALVRIIEFRGDAA